MSFDQLKISTRISLGFALITLAFIALALISALRIEQVSKASERMEAETELLSLANRWQADVRQNSARSLAVAYAEGTSMLDFFKEAMAATSANTTETQKSFLALVQDDASKKRAETVGEVRKAWLATRDEVNALKKSGDEAGARALVQNKLLPGTAEYIRATQALVDGEMGIVRDLRKEIDAMFRGLYVLGGSLLALCVAVAVLISWSLSRGIARNVDIARQTAIRIGDGDLSHAIPTDGRDELGQLIAALADMQDKLLGVT
jgi:methyl-accepting chemotaxis protein